MSDPEIQPEGPYITHLQSVAGQLHEMFLELQDAGFTHAEALQIVAVAVASGIMGPNDRYYEDFDEDEDGWDEEDDDLDINLDIDLDDDTP
jgi:hypothetical protein